MEETTITGEIITEQAPEGENEENQSNITVIDSVMGKGKTQYLIQYMNENPNKSYIYCTPFLEQIERIRGKWNRSAKSWERVPSCPNLNFQEPSIRVDRRKIDDFNKLLFEGKNIAVTHVTFANATDETLENIKNGEYVLILDETIDAIKEFNDICVGKKLQKGDILILKEKCITVDEETGVVTWTAKDEEKYSRYADIEAMSRTGSLLLIKDTFFFWEFPHQIFKLFKEIIIATYLFEGSIMSCYLKSHNISYIKKSVAVDSDDGEGNKHYSLTDYTPDTDTIQAFKSLITIFQNDKMNDYKGASLSKSWFDKYTEEIPTLKKYLSNYFRNYMKAKTTDILWTATEGAKPEEDKNKPGAKGKNRKKLEGDGYRNSFLPCNARATNLFKDRNVLAYVRNVYPKPHISDYLTNQGTPLDLEKYALCEMIQWIWRSRIRDNKPINIYIPSTRMRALFSRWLDGETIGKS